MIGGTLTGLQVIVAGVLCVVRRSWIGVCGDYSGGKWYLVVNESWIWWDLVGFGGIWWDLDLF